MLGMQALPAVPCSQKHRRVGLQAQVDFQLAEQLFARAHIRQPSSVALWLGADVMLEYPLGEASEVLARPHQRFAQLLPVADNCQFKHCLEWLIWAGTVC